MIDALDRTGELDNTYVVFISDNGFFLGEHRLERAKFLPYEPAIHMPLMVRGRVQARLPLIRSWPPTSTWRRRSCSSRGPRRPGLRRALTGPVLDRHSRRTRRPILLESFINATDIDGDGVPDGRRWRDSASIDRRPDRELPRRRLGPFKYVEYETGDRELYDLAKDPYELNNRIGYPRYRKVQARLRYLLQQLENCHGSECRVVANAAAARRPLAARGGRHLDSVGWPRRCPGGCSSSRASLLFAAGIALYIDADFSILALVLLFLVPDLSALGYLVDERVGSVAYNAVHAERSLCRGGPRWPSAVLAESRTADSRLSP